MPPTIKVGNAQSSSQRHLQYALEMRSHRKLDILAQASNHSAHPTEIKHVICLAQTQG